MADALTASEREDIYTLLTLDPSVSWAEIGRNLGRDPTTISREVNRNGGRGTYRPIKAQRRCDQQRRGQRPGGLEPGYPHRERIIEELVLGRSPYAIWADLTIEGHDDVPCVETIYQAIYDGRLNLKPSQCLRTRRPRRRHRQQRCRNKRGAGLPNITGRPDIVKDRLEAGHWEADHIIGAHNRSAMLWLTERVTRYGIGVTMPEGYAAESVLAGLIEACELIPPCLLKSITFDQGGEWAKWPQLVETYGIDVWFCDPHSPWQRGQIENPEPGLAMVVPTRQRPLDRHTSRGQITPQRSSTVNGAATSTVNHRPPSTIHSPCSDH